MQTIQFLPVQGLSDEDRRNSSYQNRCNLLNNNPVLAATNFQYKVKLFLKVIILVGPFGKQNIMLFVLNSKRIVVGMSIYLYGSSTHQILKMKMSMLSLMTKQ